MTGVAEQVGESVAAQVESVIENVTQSAATADAVNEALTEAAIRDRLSSRIDDCEEGISEWQSQNEELAGDLQALEIQNSQQARTIAQLTGQVSQMAEQLTALSTAALLPLTRQNSAGETLPLSEVQLTNPEASPSNEEGDGQRGAEKAPAKSRGRVI